jgi:hypothetical protein
MKKLILGLIMIFSINLMNAQVFNLEKQDAKSLNIIEEFTKYEVYNLALADLSAYLEEQNGAKVQLKNDDYTWDIEFVPNSILGPDFHVTELTPQGKIRTKYNETHSYIAYVDGQKTPSRFYISDNRIQGRLEYRNQTFMIESLKKYDNYSEMNHVIMYDVNDRTKDDEEEKHVCDLLPSFDDVASETEIVNRESGQRSTCVEFEVAVAADYLMFNYHGSIEDVIAFMVTVINDVEGTYSAAFNSEIQFQFVELLVSTCDECDPWTSSTNNVELIGDFRGWGLDGGFDNEYDFASLWTKRVLDNNVAGSAYGNGICGSNPYNLLRHWTNNANKLRVMVSHEIGHGMGAGHNYTHGDQCANNGRPRLIMDPQVYQSAQAWSTGEEECALNATLVINNKIAEATCLDSNCGENYCNNVEELQVEDVYANYTSVTWQAEEGAICNVKLKIEGEDEYVTEFLMEGTSCTFTNELQPETNYVFIITGVCGPDESDIKSAFFTTPEASQVIPVELISFSAELNEKKVDLAWETASEINSDYFQIMRSTDGINFVELGTVESKGSTVELQSYGFIDNRPSVGANYYTLVQNDFDGRQETFETKVVTYRQAKENLSLTVARQTANEVELSISDEYLSPITITIVDAHGKVLNSRINQQTGNIRLDTSNYSAGIYFVVATTQLGKETLKFMKI